MLTGYATIPEQTGGRVRDEAAAHHKRFLALDMVRGVAAISVVVFHATSTFSFPIAPYAYLAVDLFFCLSGYVLAHAYTDRFNTENAIVPFVIDRLIRLMPMIWLGISLCAFNYVIYGGSKTIAIVGFLFGILNLPMLKPPTTFHQYYVFPLTPSQYSLFLELAINIFWVTLRKHKLVLIAAAGASAVAFVVFGSGGAQPANFWNGFPRVGVSFLVGVFLYRLETRAAEKITLKAAAPVFWLLFAVAIFVLYLLRGKFYKEVIVCGWVFIASPLLVLLGAQVALPQSMKKAAVLAGNLSYPIYALHLGFVLLINKCINVLMELGMQKPNDIVMLCIALATIAVGSWAAYLYIDIPARAWLTRRFRSARPKMTRVEQSAFDKCN